MIEVDNESMCGAVDEHSWVSRRTVENVDNANVFAIVAVAAVHGTTKNAMLVEELNNVSNACAGGNGLQRIKGTRQGKVYAW